MCLRHLAVLLLALAASACGTGDKDTDGDGETPPVPVEIAATARGAIAAVYSGTTALEADQEAAVLAKVGGEVIELRVEEGDPVEAGQVLAVLDGDRLRLEMQRSLAELRRLEQDYKRNVELHEKGLVSAGAFETMKYELEALEAAHELATLELGYTQIRAPIDGVISQRFIKVGNTLSVNEPTFHLTDLDPLLAYLHVPEREYRQLEPGQQAIVEVDALAGRRFAARVARISPTVDPATGTFKVAVEVGDADEQLKPGMFSRVSIVYDTHGEALLIPRAALVDDDTSAAVFVVDDGVARRTEVRTGYVDGGKVEVLEGLDHGDQVVVIGQNGLRDGARVDVVNGGQPSAMRASSEAAGSDGVR
jgi:membrane fusion protein (multidrug efflux system)